ncbi:hypothetical protein [Carbonactinospora thermoautotrophica]|uniref:hypothetical protein n=1 Tax=Carbonactinospora thermoautotrophica TaxID=1469144 RepID=UPI003DA986CE
MAVRRGDGGAVRGGCVTGFSVAAVSGVPVTGGGDGRLWRLRLLAQREREDPAADEHGHDRRRGGAR